MKNIHYTIRCGFLLTLMLMTPGISSAVAMPDLTNTILSVKINYDQNTGVYTYLYTIDNTQSVEGVITGLSIKNNTQVDQPITPHPDLFNDDSLFLDLHPVRFVPVGLESPSGWEVSRSRLGDVMWSGVKPVTDILPGTLLTGLIVHSKAPPGIREYEIEPIVPEGPGSPYFGVDCVVEDCPPYTTYYKYGTIFGPMLPEELVLIDGKGQRASDVNTFLRYSGIDTTTINLPAGTTSYDLAVRFGSTIDPNSVKSILNRQDITSGLFVYPDVTTVINLTLQPGRNVLVLSVDGVRNDGRTATDTDRLVFIVQ